MEQSKLNLEGASMVETLELENVPEDVATELALRAFRNGRSLREELLAILGTALSRDAPSQQDLKITGVPTHE
jgi:plasmid stability protein